MQLITLISKIILEEAGFVINKILEDCKKQAEELRKKKDKLTQDSNAISLRNKYNDKSKEETKTAIKKFTVIPKKEVEDLSGEESNKGEEWKEKVSCLKKEKDATVEITKKEGEDWQENCADIPKSFKGKTRKEIILEAGLMEYKLEKVETDKLEMDAKIALAAKDLISNSQNEIKSSKQKVQELQNSVKKEKNVNRMLGTEPDVYKSRLEELQAYKNKYCAEKKKRQNLERELRISKKNPTNLKIRVGESWN